MRKLLVLLNFTNKLAATQTGLDLGNATVMIGNYQKPSKNGMLMPYEAVVYELKH